MQHEEQLQAILSNLKIKQLNDMQLAALETVKNTDNTLLLSATGSGKTLAFLLPLLGMLDKENLESQAIIIVPSRELAMQIELVFKQMQTGFKVTCCYGGHKREIEENNLIQPPALLIGTPGRLADHIRRGSITAQSITTLILDEFDKTLELGFTEEVEFIISSLPNIKKRILTSATNSAEIPVFVGFEPATTLNFLTGAEEKEMPVEIKLVRSDDKDKIETLFRLLCFVGQGNRSSIVFCNHRESVERCSERLKEHGIVTEFYHGAMEQYERDSALNKFRNGTTDVLITTDLAARGLDIPHIRNIIHYHMPGNEAIFTHRNGRTARMDASGTAILILSEDEYVPAYVAEEVQEMTLPEEAVIPKQPEWVTVFIAAGKKDKINKVDIVGFLSHKANLKKEEIGLIDVKDFSSFVAIRKSKANQALQHIREEKIKNKKVKIEIAK